jgi:hypothetical protein
MGKVLWAVLLTLTIPSSGVGCIRTSFGLAHTSHSIVRLQLAELTLVQATSRDAREVCASDDHVSCARRVLGIDTEYRLPPDRTVHPAIDNRVGVVVNSSFLWPISAEFDFSALRLFMFMDHSSDATILVDMKIMSAGDYRDAGPMEYVADFIGCDGSGYIAARDNQPLAVQGPKSGVVIFTALDVPIDDVAVEISLTPTGSSEKAILRLDYRRVESSLQRIRHEGDAG